jgi:hypothetical protein
MSSAVGSDLGRRQQDGATPGRSQPGAAGLPSPHRTGRQPAIGRILVTSASGTNGDGYGTILTFSASGNQAGPFSDDPRITDPAGCCAECWRW